MVCSFTTLEEPKSIYVPLFIAVGILAGTGLFHALLKFAYRRYLLSREDTRSDLLKDLGDLPQPSASTYTLTEEDVPNFNQLQQQQQQRQQLVEEVKALGRLKKISRMKSVDVLRGVCLAIMIFVNYGAGGYSLLDHAPWNGLHLVSVWVELFGKGLFEL